MLSLKKIKDVSPFSVILVIAVLTYILNAHVSPALSSDARWWFPMMKMWLYHQPWENLGPQAFVPFGGGSGIGSGNIVNGMYPSFFLRLILWLIAFGSTSVAIVNARLNVILIMVAAVIIFFAVKRGFKVDTFKASLGALFYIILSSFVIDTAMLLRNLSPMHSVIVLLVVPLFAYGIFCRNIYVLTIGLYLSAMTNLANTFLMVVALTFLVVFRYVSIKTYLIAGLISGLAALVSGLWRILWIMHLHMIDMPKISQNTGHLIIQTMKSRSTDQTIWLNGFYTFFSPAGLLFGPLIVGCLIYLGYVIVMKFGLGFQNQDHFYQKIKQSDIRFKILIWIIAVGLVLTFTSPLFNEIFWSIPQPGVVLYRLAPYLTVYLIYVIFKYDAMYLLKGLSLSLSIMAFLFISSMFLIGQSDANSSNQWNEKRMHKLVRVYTHHGKFKLNSTSRDYVPSNLSADDLEWALVQKHFKTQFQPVYHQDGSTQRITVSGQKGIWTKLPFYAYSNQLPIKPTMHLQAENGGLLKKKDGLWWVKPSSDHQVISIEKGQK